MPKLKRNDRTRLIRYFQYKALDRRYKVLDKIFNIKSGDVIIDGGSFHGDMAIYFSKRVGDKGKILTFEALPHNIPQLQNNIELFNCNNIKIFNGALWNEDTDVTFYLSDYPNAGSPLRDFRKVRSDYIDIQGVKLDSIIKKLGINKVDFIWTNIEGSELRALKGMKNTLKNNNCKLCISTHKISDTYQNTQDVIDLLLSYGYNAKPVDEEHKKWIYADKIPS